MGLAGFKYLSWKRLTALTLIVAVSSMLFSITVLSLLGFYRGFTAYLGEENNVVAIYDKASSTPFTGVVPAYIAENVARRVSACSPEVLAPCIIKGKAFFIRGVLPAEFMKITDLKILEGEMLNSADLNSAVLGLRAAEKLGLRVNDRITVFGVMADRCLELTVKGVYQSNSPLDDEVLAPLHVGQWLRGAGYGYVTLIRIKNEDAQSLRDTVYMGIASSEAEIESGEAQTPVQEPPKPLQEMITPRVIVRFKPENLGVEDVQRFMKNYMDRYGLTREVMLIFSSAVFLFSSLSITAAAKTIIAHHKGEISVLRSLGASKRTLKWDLLAKLIPWCITASLLGLSVATVTLMAVQSHMRPEILSHTLMLHFDPIIVALPPILSSALVSAYILKAEVEV
ncbi:MAG: ABC transporter permease [Nitrososphaerota archaeon]|nr:ABC transporter permease [Candidatus Bathyarchaeota archaeon]MDW8194085.1 ABC transporter permease [Nitrososphaerota archaeon]